MLSGARGPYGSQPARPNWLRGILIALGLFVLVVFAVDKLVLSPAAAPTPVATVVDHLNRHDVRRVMIPAGEVTIELNDGKTLTTAVTTDRDLWPAIRRSGADVTILPGARNDTALMGYVFQFVPFIIMALLLLFILRTSARSRPLQ